MNRLIGDTLGPWSLHVEVISGVLAYRPSVLGVPEQWVLAYESVSAGDRCRMQALWKRRPLVKLETMGCRFGPISTRKRAARAAFRSRPRGTVLTDVGAPHHTAMLVYRGLNQEPWPPRIAWVSEPGLLSVRGTTPPSHDHHPLHPPPPPRPLLEKNASLPPAVPPPASQHQNPVQWYRCRATASTGMGIYGQRQQQR